MTKPDNPNIIDFDLGKHVAGGRHQIGTLAGFRSEQVAGFLLECMAGFVGIRRGRRLVLESTRDVSERKAMRERQQLLLGELTHRVKNSLAVVQSIANQTLRHSPSKEEFVEGFSGRLSAMANAHGLLVQSDWIGADLDALARIQLKPYAAEGSGRLRVEGPPVLLPSDLATPVGLVLHELATNAAKYGSLSRPTGNVSVNWSLGTGNDPRRLLVVWQETGGPSVREPVARGFGSTLIEKGIPGATVQREFRLEGLVCTIDLPLP